MVANICIGIGCFSLLYYLIIICYAGITADFAWFWALMGILFVSGGNMLRHRGGNMAFIPCWIRFPVGMMVMIGCIVGVVLMGHIIIGMTWNGRADCDYVIVLGAQVKGDKPSKALKLRLDKALDYAEKNKNTKLILTGGQGSGEEITEAECMRRYLTKSGISGARLILEDRSTTTSENLKFADELTGCSGKSVGIISNNFHIYRAVKMAEHLNYTKSTGIAAPSDPIMQLHYVVREVMALIKAYLKRDIRLL